MTIGFERDGFGLALAMGEDDVRAAQNLRYDVFVRELGGAGAGVDHAARREADPFDAFCDHLVLRDLETGEAVGAYRLMRGDQARAAGGFYSEAEYDLTPLRRSGRALLELGRSCVRADHRRGTAMYHLWAGLARYVALHGSELLFGVASFPGTDPVALAHPLSHLHHRCLAPAALRPRARDFQRMDLLDPASIDRRRAMLEMPPLVKAYLRLGGVVGEGAFVDSAFNCIDICMMLDAAALDSRAARLYQTAAAE
jgi:putative hemolysin